MLKKRYIIRTILITVGVILFLGIAFTLEQYYRLHISNFRSRDGEAHSYNIYPGTSIDSVMHLLENDYEIGSPTDFMLHARVMHFNYPEPGHYMFPEQLGNHELIDRLKYGKQTPIALTWNNFVRTREDLAGRAVFQPLQGSLEMMGQNAVLPQIHRVEGQIAPGKEPGR